MGEERRVRGNGYLAECHEEGASGHDPAAQPGKGIWEIPDD
jgi:hypothetical protein